jgi:hypothetical protein
MKWEIGKSGQDLNLCKKHEFFNFIPEIFTSLTHRHNLGEQTE